MADYSFVPVDYQPDFEGVSLVPVDHDPFADDTIPQPPLQLQKRAASIDQPVGGGQFSSATASSNKLNEDIGPTLPFAPSKNYKEQTEARLPELNNRTDISGNSGLPLPNVDSNVLPEPSQRYSMVSHAAYSKCVDKCLHLLSSPSGDLQSSEFRLCVAQCMGRL